MASKGFKSACKSATLASKQFDYDTIKRIVDDLRLLGLTNSEIEEFIIRIYDKKCPFCLSPPFAPTMLINPKCASCPTLNACLTCMRDFLKLNLNLPKEYRPAVKHLICQDEYRTWEMSSSNYVINMGLMEFLDKAGVKPPECPRCGAKHQSHIAAYCHISPSWRTYLSCDDVVPCTADRP